MSTFDQRSVKNLIQANQIGNVKQNNNNNNLFGGNLKDQNGI